MNWYDEGYYFPKLSQNAINTLSRVLDHFIRELGGSEALIKAIDKQGEKKIEERKDS